MSFPGDALSMDMNPDEYIKLLVALRGLGYTCCDINQVVPRSGQLFLRHDIDLDLGLAAEMAEAEAREGFQSTYYVLLTSDFYNVFSKESSLALRRIVDAGHSIGLHLDAGNCPDFLTALDDKASRELHVLETIVGEHVESLSFHRPIPALQNMPRLVAGRQHTYMPKLFSEIRYFSDSGGSFRFGLPLSDAGVQRCEPLQLLTHPIWWFESGVDGEEKMIRFRTRQDQLVHRSMVSNLKPYALMAERGAVR